ncbi:hypothetical protein RZS28_08095 [Methylocapsa polymorpha]|uniref:Uncharacterized protein n=1 Tax=Methylocapsa polymorpha TaxID=3080828 RepID=A0ABZ0HXC8_9HYPH|nr:hypothetical protein RZS28_08095 [Methylocapsa sp. RX1]
MEVGTLQRTEGSADEPDLLQLAKNVLAVETGQAIEAPFRLRDALQPGGCGAMVLELALDEYASPLTINITASALVGAGSRIGVDSIWISPSTVTLRPAEPAQITVTIVAPLDARPGLYVGTLSATGDETFVAPLQAEIC